MTLARPIRSCSVAAVALFILWLASGCGPVKQLSDGGADFTEPAQQIGDLMASVDESGGTNGNFGMLEGARRMYARLEPASLTDRMIAELGVPDAHAATCASAPGFSTCSGNIIRRSFNNCTVGTATFAGDVLLTYSNPLCQVSALNDTVVRVPNFTVTGRRGATLEVTRSGTVGQKITRTTAPPAVAVYSFTNDGIRRKFTTTRGTVPFNFLTETATPVTISGSARAGRVISGGTVRVTNSLSGVTCDYVPSGVTWAGTCNCATSGTWAATCSDGKTATLKLTGCGTADFKVAELSGSLTFDRCYGI